MNRILILSSQADTADKIKHALPNDCQMDRSKTIEDALTKNGVTPFDLVFADLHLLKEASGSGDYAEAIAQFRKSNPLIEFVVLTSKDTIREAVRAVKAGANDYITDPIDDSEVQVVAGSFREMLTRNLELDYLRDRFWKTEWLEVIQSRSPIMRPVYENIRSVAPTIATVLLLGETGTGKGLMARLIHWHSNRFEEPFIAVHCGAIPETLLESELFGHEKGAFTGADRKKLGKFELARNGTIFLDEIGTIAPAAQVKLLQVLQDGTYSRVGGESQFKANARIIAATNADLKVLSDEGKFRKDLYYRLNVFPVSIPPLRDRLEDIPHLVEVFINNLNDRYGKKISSVHRAVTESFKTYNWPGNIRELENVLERAYILETGNKLMPQRFPSDVIGTEDIVSVHIPESGLPLAEARQKAIGEFEREYILHLLRRNAGRINQSAAAANITPRQLNRLMSRYGLDKKDFKT